MDWIHRAALAQFRRARAAGLDDRPPLYRHAGRRGGARPPDLAGSARCRAIISIDEDGTVFRLVEEASAPGMPASRAGAGSPTSTAPASASRSSIRATNSAIATSPTSRSASLIPLIADIKERHGIGRGNVVGHSDVAPARKEDPGELFPWDALRSAGSPCRARPATSSTRIWTDGGFLLALGAVRLRRHRSAEGGDRLPAPLPSRPDRRDHRRRVPRQAAGAAAAAAAVRAKVTKSDVRWGGLGALDLSVRGAGSVTSV